MISDVTLAPELLTTAHRVVTANLAIGRRFAIAESCTGGLVSAAITSVPGSSAVFELGLVTYANDAKQALLRVEHDILSTFGAVSPATAWAMARGTLALSPADVAVAITGIAGPGGGSPEKPVGMVVFARALRTDTVGEADAQTRQFGDIGRGQIRLQAALVALELLMPLGTP